MIASVIMKIQFSKVLFVKFDSLSLVSNLSSSDALGMSVGSPSP